MLLNLWGVLNQWNPHLLLAWTIRQHWVRKRPPGLWVLSLGPADGQGWDACSGRAVRSHVPYAGSHNILPNTVQRRPYRPSAGETRSQKNDQESRTWGQRYCQCPQSTQQLSIYEAETDRHLPLLHCKETVCKTVEVALLPPLSLKPGGNRSVLLMLTELPATSVCSEGGLLPFLHFRGQK